MSDRGLKKVLLTGDTVGGVWTFTLDLAQGLIQQGIEVCLLTFGRRVCVAQRKEAAAIRGLEWLDSDYKLEWMDHPWSDVEQSGRWALEVAKRFKPDVVHLNTLCHGALDWNAPVVITVHSCVASWWAAVKREPLPQQWDRYRKQVEYSLECADLVTAASRVMLESINQNYGINPAQARVIPNGRRSVLYREESKHPLILAAGRLWDEGKNLRTLAQVAPLLPWPVFLAGDCRSPDGSQAVLPGCHLLGQLSTAELASWYARAAIYALPARYEPFGLSVLEDGVIGLRVGAG